MPEGSQNDTAKTGLACTNEVIDGALLDTWGSTGIFWTLSERGFVGGFVFFVNFFIFSLTYLRLVKYLYTHLIR